jgi:hypothetical protein
MMTPSAASMPSISSLHLSSVNRHRFVPAQLPQLQQPRTGSVPSWNHTVSTPARCSSFSTIDKDLAVSPFFLGLPFTNNTFIMLPPAKYGF